MIQIMTELEDVKDDLFNLVTGKVTLSQIQFLKDTEGTQDNPAIDPSVQFFGVEWNCVFAKCFNLGLNIRIFKQHHRQNEVDRLHTVGPPCLCRGRARVQPLLQGREGLPRRSEAQDPLCRWLPAKVPIRQD